MILWPDGNVHPTSLFACRSLLSACLPVYLSASHQSGHLDDSRIVPNTLSWTPLKNATYWAIKACE